MNTKETRYIDPLTDLGALLLHVEKPARYTGGEYGRLLSSNDHARKDVILKTLIAFPDLYEIGMSNQAVRILYNSLNRLEGVFCDRSFAPAPDFEDLLRKSKFPLYGLDTGINLKDVDLLMFSLGYELLITNVLTMLDISGIPIRSNDRGEEDPIVIMGGPSISNPLPYADFIDAFWIGEAESGFFALVSELKEIKKSGGKRDALLSKLIEHPSVWANGKGSAVRAVNSDFSNRTNTPAIFPVPSMKVIHHHGAVEIMRGCANGCRFCHAGYWYRPMRQKNADIVEKECEAFIKTGGYREITLSSLSSGDYQYLENLIDGLNEKYRSQHISFQLPSLRVSSFSLDLLEKISMVRKSGLTFAVETPSDFWQMAINKQVKGEDVISILRESKRRGWRSAKFYFMIGLPLERHAEENITDPVGSGGTRNIKKSFHELKSEEEEIVLFVERVSQQTGMRFNINIGTFVPKPHTPFQWAKQISRDEAEKKLNYIRARLKPRGHKVGIQDPLISVIEGIASRGDKRAGVFFEEAHKIGCRLDSWAEYLKRDVWEELLKRNKELLNEILSEKEDSSTLPWASVDSRISKDFFSQELNNSKNGKITSSCINKCNVLCNNCDNSLQIVQNTVQLNSKSIEKMEQIVVPKRADPDTFRIIFSFAKQKSAVFHPHLGILEIFFMSFVRAGIPVRYSQGYNPLPKLEIASPLSLGLKAGGEIAAIDTECFFEAEKFKKAFNSFLPEGFEVTEAMNVFIPSGAKKHSLSSLLWGYMYAAEDGKTDMVPVKDEKAYREARICQTGSIYNLERLSVLAKRDKKNEDAAPDGISYFEVYKDLYPDQYKNT